MTRFDFELEVFPPSVRPIYNCGGPSFNYESSSSSSVGTSLHGANFILRLINFYFSPFLAPVVHSHRPVNKCLFTVFLADWTVVRHPRGLLSFALTTLLTDDLYFSISNDILYMVWFVSCTFLIFASVATSQISTVKSTPPDYSPAFKTSNSFLYVKFWIGIKKFINGAPN